MAAPETVVTDPAKTGNTEVEPGELTAVDTYDRALALANEAFDQTEVKDKDINQSYAIL